VFDFPETFDAKTAGNWPVKRDSRDARETLDRPAHQVLRFRLGVRIGDVDGWIVNLRNGNPPAFAFDAAAGLNICDDGPPLTRPVFVCLTKRQSGLSPFLWTCWSSLVSWSRDT
jgi:hypothetical protein